MREKTANTDMSGNCNQSDRKGAQRRNDSNCGRNGKWGKDVKNLDYPIAFICALWKLVEDWNAPSKMLVTAMLNCTKDLSEK